MLQAKITNGRHKHIILTRIYERSEHKFHYLNIALGTFIHLKTESSMHRASKTEGVEGGLNAR